MQECPERLIDNLILIPLSSINLNILVNCALFELLDFSASLQVQQAFFLTQVFIISDGPGMHQLLSILFRQVRLVVALYIIIKDVLLVSLEPSL